MGDSQFWAMDENPSSQVPKYPEDVDIDKFKHRRIIRSASERHVRKKLTNPQLPTNEPSTEPPRLILKPPTPSPKEERPEEPRPRTGFSLRNISRSLGFGKSRTGSSKDLPLRDEPSEHDSNDATGSSVASSADSPKIDKKASGFKRFFVSLRGKKPASSNDLVSEATIASDNNLLQSSTISTKTSEFFKSKKGKQLWVSRYGQEEYTMTDILIRDLIDLEAACLKKYAIMTLSDTLMRPVMYDPFSIRSHNRDLMYRRSTFGEKFRSAFKKQSTNTVTSPLKPDSSSSSSLNSIFGRNLDEVLLEDRMRTGNKRLKVPLIVSTATEYLKQHTKFPGIFRVSGSAKRIRQLNELLESGSPIDLLSTATSSSSSPSSSAQQQQQPSDVASVLKYFLRELPEPLLTFDLYHNFIDISELKSVEDQLLSLRLLCCLLPAINRDILCELLSLLASIAQQADQPDGSKMNSRNLALIFAPTLLKDKVAMMKSKGGIETGSLAFSQTDDVADNSLVSAENEASEIIELMIDFNDQLFLVPAELRDQSLVYQQSIDSETVSQIFRTLLRRQAEPFDLEETANYASPSPSPDILSNGGRGRRRSSSGVVRQGSGRFLELPNKDNSPFPLLNAYDVSPTSSRASQSLRIGKFRTSNGSSTLTSPSGSNHSLDVKPVQLSRLSGGSNASITLEPNMSQPRGVSTTSTTPFGTPLTPNLTSTLLGSSHSISFSMSKEEPTHISSLSRTSSQTLTVPPMILKRTPSLKRGNSDRRPDFGTAV